MSATKRYFEARSEELGFDGELSDEAIEAIHNADAGQADYFNDVSKGN